MTGQPEDDRTAGREPSRDFGRAAARLARQIEVALIDVELSLAQYRLLLFLDGGSARASALADHLAVSRPSVTAVVDGLVARGLVERRHEEADRRRVGHTITEDGLRVLRAADDAVASRLEEILSSASDPAVARSALGGLEAWRAALDSFRAAKQAARRAEAMESTG